MTLDLEPVPRPLNLSLVLWTRLVLALVIVFALVLIFFSLLLVERLELSNQTRPVTLPWLAFSTRSTMDDGASTSAAAIPLPADTPFYTYRDIRIGEPDWNQLVGIAQTPAREGLTEDEQAVYQLIRRLASVGTSPLAQEVDDLQLELNNTTTELLNARNRITELERNLGNALALGAAQNGGNSRFPDAPTFDGTKPSDLRTWILQLRNKLAAEPYRYTDEQSRLRYALNRLAGSALNQVRSSVNEDTGIINFPDLNSLLVTLRQAYDDLDRQRTANREIRLLRQRNLSFVSYLADFQRIMADLQWDEQAKKAQLYEGLSEEMKDALVQQSPVNDSLNAYIDLCKTLDTRLRARAEEKRRFAPRTSTSTTPVSRPANRSTPAPTTTSTTQVHPSLVPGGPAPIDLSVAERNARRQQTREKRLAEGLCLYCGQPGHLRLNCPARAASEARRNRITAAATSTSASTSAPTPEPRIQDVTEQSGN